MKQDAEEEVKTEANYRLAYPSDNTLSQEMKEAEKQIIRFAATRLNSYIARVNEKSSKNSVSGYSYSSYLVTVSNRKDISPITINRTHPDKLTLEKLEIFSKTKPSHVSNKFGTSGEFQRSGRKNKMSTCIMHLFTARNNNRAPHVLYLVD